ncbi:Glutamyl-tRNA(Gln) amidotransferase subunit A-like protein [Fulvivirga imtechensis AK7]|uniref:Glutamyl-tRNA(Gln) amidotransferase subunit A-like protein n=1 Tax=Fulvivirga imtechensis AK7 TaxID=1237149 RepID=L8K060_9BACT|nr:amidase [Fulvivirga imtechensis]ELR72857.1 Glutamyl-tRNA(Gln) amidotransferase subunit A-like protein [Fulvivirga imtechensis AK7]
MKNPILFAAIAFLLLSCVKQEKEPAEGAIDSLAYVEPYLGLSFTQSKRDSLREGLRETVSDIRKIHAYSLENSTPPAISFNPIPVGFQINQLQLPINWRLPSDVKFPVNENELAFYTVAELSVLIRTGQISSEDLTLFFLGRLKQYGDTLQCVVTLTEELALEQAKRADAELANGKYRGPLHGIPYGIKDLLAVEGYNTTWGATPYKNQQIDGTAAVVKKLEEEGAVLVAKLTLGALAMGDIWYGGVTKNPWDLKQGSSGSSAGSAAATAAGLVPFAIGSETWGSIISPSTRCGTTGLRPTFGRVSRTGAMALSWTMDKLGPICRSAKDCALVFEVIRGSDGIDQSVIDAAFNFNAATPAHQLKVGYLKTLFEQQYPNSANDSISLAVFRDMGLQLHEVELPEDIPVNALSIILAAEAAAAFDELTRSGRDSLLVNQKKSAWPNYFRTARFISAVDYINANRIRYELIQKMNEVLKEYDAIIAPSFGGNQLLMTNLTGHPCVVFPNGFNAEGKPASISIIGNLFDEAKLLQLAEAYQAATGVDEMHPEMFK